MQQHTRGKVRGSSDGYNANRELPPSVKSFVESVSDRFIGEGPAIEYLRAAYREKYTGSGSEFSATERRSRAIAKWLTQESANRRNDAYLRGLDRGYNILPRVTFYNFLRVAQHYIAEVLGELSNEIVIGGFSGGASTGRRRTSSSPAEKFVGLADVTVDASPYVGVIHQQTELYRQHGTFYNLREVEGAVLFTVPKKADIDRCACKEPEINMFLQKGVGKHIRSRLRRVGINLNDQSINRSLARVGSITGDLATIDLSSASDSVTTACVRALLPTVWFLYLNDIRSRKVVIDGGITETSMFSSMGNGFTFELESLIFWALMKAVAYTRGYTGTISVYGDDIIIPSGMYDDASWVLSEFGFRTNDSKSFAEGPFRESCGGHYYLGEDITPFYLRNEPRYTTDLIRVCNQLRRWALTEGHRQYEYDWAFQLWNELAVHVPRKLWGGYDLEVDTRLASPPSGSFTLNRVSARKRLPDLGLYLHWHTLNRNRTRDPDNGFSATDTSNWCRYRRAKPGALSLSWYFHEEVVGPTVVR